MGNNIHVHGVVDVLGHVTNTLHLQVSLSSPSTLTFYNWVSLHSPSWLELWILLPLQVLGSQVSPIMPSVPFILNMYTEL